MEKNYRVDRKFLPDTSNHFTNITTHLLSSRIISKLFHRVGYYVMAISLKLPCVNRKDDAYPVNFLGLSKKSNKC